MKPKLFWTVFFITIFILLLTVLISKSEDYSSDFEYSMMEWEEQAISTSGITSNPLIGQNSPSAKYNAVVEAQKWRKVIDSIYRRQQYEYRPYSPSVYQKRRTYDPRKTDWSDPWYD